MDFKSTYPDFASVEEHIRRARAERSVALAHYIASLIETVVRGVKKFGEFLDRGLAVERERSVIESDPFLKRSVPRY